MKKKDNFRLTDIRTDLFAFYIGWHHLEIRPVSISTTGILTACDLCAIETGFYDFTAGYINAAYSPTYWLSSAGNRPQAVNYGDTIIARMQRKQIDVSLEEIAIKTDIGELRLIPAADLANKVKRVFCMSFLNNILTSASTLSDKPHVLKIKTLLCSTKAQLPFQPRQADMLQKSYNTYVDTIKAIEKPKP